jgi:acyl carrier protein
MLSEGGQSVQAEQAVHGRLRLILEEGGLPAEFKNQDRLEAIGLKSLDLARLVAELEVELGFDPFAETIPITSMRTVGDLVEAYSGTSAGTSAAGTEDPALAAAAERARARRRRSSGA